MGTGLGNNGWGGFTASTIPLQIVFGGKNTLRFQGIMSSFQYAFTLFDGNMIPVEANAEISVMRVYNPDQRRSPTFVNSPGQLWTTTGQVGPQSPLASGRSSDPIHAMIVNGPRYMGQPVVPVTLDAQGDSAVAVFGPTPTFPAAFAYYTVVAGDRLDSIAYDLYGLPDLWWKIANANPEIFYPDNLVVGSIIRIPTVTVTTAQATALPIFDPGGACQIKNVNTVKVMQTESMHDTAIITLRGANTAAPELQPGTPVQMQYGWQNVDLEYFYGYIDHVESHYDRAVGDGATMEDVVCLGASYALKDPYVGAWTSIQASSLVQAVAGKYYLSSVIESDDTVWSQLSAPGDSAWQFLVQMASKTGYSLACNKTMIRFMSVDLAVANYWSTMPVFISRNVAASYAGQSHQSVPVRCDRRGTRPWRPHQDGALHQRP